MHHTVNTEGNEQGYLITDENRKTSVDGVYGAGDVCIKILRQVVTAVSDGAVAATSLEKHVSVIHEKLQLTGLFAKFTGKAVIRALLDESSLAGEMNGFPGKLLPAFRIEREDGSGGNVLFHGEPGGHEFNSFIIYLYNMAGPGQPVDEALRQRIASLNRDINVKVMVSLSCTMCPEVVMGVQRVAALSDRVTGEMIDLQHYPELKKKYQVMSVPCMVVNDSQVYFGKKNLEEITGLLEKAL